MNYDEAIGWLYSKQLHGIRLGLENIQRLCESLAIPIGGPGAPRFIHVAGTNGKGSTCAMLDSICRAAGWRTGFFSSPHLITFRERIRLNGNMISETEVAEGLTRICEQVTDWEHSPTFFEIATALALDYFGRCRAEVVILETGMGGRLDATNVVQPVVTVITSIELDHQQWLGATLAEIASEKAGILKPGVPVITVPQPEEVGTVISHTAIERDAGFFQVATPLENVEISLPGSHQQWNAALAVHALDLAGMAIPGEAIIRGLAAIDWPGRFQRIGSGLILDGAHNPAAAARLVETWREIFADEQATIVLAVLRDKDVPGVCQALAPIAARVLTVSVQNERTSSADELAKIFTESAPGVEVWPMESLSSALVAAQTHPEKVLVTGSLFLIGEMLARLEGEAAVEVSAQ